MYFEWVSFGSAIKILKNKHNVWKEIVEIFQKFNPIIRWHGQTRLNREIDRLFKQYKGWTRQIDHLLKTESHLPRKGPKSVDFRNTDEKVDVEIEFGNVASFYRDVFKLSISKKAKLIDVGIIVMMNREAAKAMGENIASFERFKDELSITWKYKANIDCPILLIGLLPLSYPDKNNLIDPKSIIQRKKLQEKRKKREKDKIKAI